MQRYFFDIRDGRTLVVDEEGLELADDQAAEAEAARSLADMARDKVLAAASHVLTIEVRTAKGPVATARLQWELQKHQRPN
ncbi:hypothetical protein GA0061098_1015107 [Bradyrhizobium shewense]|uniref:DUF6894 domain-containing protein n=1 Tax=Bradyrhizobium shewense TaxID=1761772 RepID=A0A1C3XG19_9BRAD|nr:hypothetical protein [Bradyrhizobium shewense]SCB51217.1 hypothetical protein GA0061098_1015107 [Bradyrhizobium shewense]